MPKHLECVIPDCGFTMTAATEQEIMKQVEAHAVDAHGVTEIPPALVAQVKAAIRDEAEDR